MFAQEEAVIIKSSPLRFITMSGVQYLACKHSFDYTHHTIDDSATSSYLF